VPIYVTEGDKHSYHLAVRNKYRVHSDFVYALAIRNFCHLQNTFNMGIYVLIMVIFVLFNDLFNR
jgi:hypothetical protein